MKKIILLIAVLVIALSTPLLVGSNIESRMDEFVVSLNETPGYVVTIDSYEPGYLHSNALMRVAFDPALFTSGMTPEQVAQMQSFLNLYSEGVLFNVAFSHGPYVGSEQQSFGLFVANITFAQTPEFIKAFKVQNGIDELFATEVIMGFGGNGEVNVNSPSFEVNADGNEFSYGGFDLFATLKNWGAEYDAKGEFHESYVYSPLAQFTANLLPISYTASGDLSNGFMFATGDAEIHFSGLKVKGPMNINMENLDMLVSVTAPSEETLSVDYQIRMEALKSSLMEFPLENSVLDFSLSNLQTQALISYYESLSIAGATQDPVLMQQNLIKQMTDIFSGAEYRINQLSFEFGDAITFALASGFSLGDDVGAILADPAAMQNPLMLMGSISADLDLSFSEGFLDFALDTFLQNQSASLIAAGIQESEIPMMVEQQKTQYLMMIPQFVQSGILQTNNTGYSISALFAEGELKVNGEPYPLPF